MTAPMIRYPSVTLTRVAPAPSTPGLSWFLARKVRLFRRAPADAVRFLAGCAFSRRYGRGEHVCRTGEEAREIWVVRSGRLSVRQMGWTGQLLSQEYMVPGDVSGMAAVGCRTYPGEVVATEPSVLVVIPVAELRRALERWPELAREVLYFYCQRIQYIESLFSLSREPVEKRLIAALLFLYGKFGFSIPLTCAEIGGSAGTTPETTMRVLKAFERRGWVRRARRRVEIADLSGLKGALGAELSEA